MAKNGGGEFVGDRCNHTAVFAQENKRASTREEDIGRSFPGKGAFTIRVLFFVPFCNNGIGDGRPCLMAFDVDTYQAKLVEGNSGHPCWSRVGFQNHPHFPRAGILHLVYSPSWHVIAPIPCTCRLSHD